MYLSTKSVIAALLLSSSSTHAFAYARENERDSGVGVTALTSDQLLQKMNSFRTEFEQWQEKHSVVYDSVEHAMSRMAKWVDNHGTYVCSHVRVFVAS